MNICDKIFEFDKTHFKIIFESFQICCHFGRPLTSIFPWFGMICDVDAGIHDFRLYSSRLIYLRKFDVVVDTKCWKETLCVDYKAKFAGVKEAG